MGKFRLYKIALSLSHTKEGDWTQSIVSEPTELSKAQDLFEQILVSAYKNEERHLPIGKEPETGNKVLPNTIIRIEKGVTLLKLHNPKNVNIWPLNGEKYPENSFPYSYVIIDNRKGIGQMAIQMNTEAWSDPDDVKNLLQENLKRILKDRVGLEIEIRYKWLPTEFFNFIKERKKKDEVYVKHLYFQITNPEFETPIETAVETSGHIRQLMNMLSQLGGAKATLQVDAPRKKELIKRKLRDIKQMVSLVASNGYSLKVVFSDGRSYTCNDWTLADFDMEDKTLNDFYYGQMNNFFEFEIFHWLDEKRNETKDYFDEARPIRQKPARKGRKKIS